MAKFTIPQPLTVCDATHSRPLNPSKHSLLTLPAEIQNQIFGYLVEFSKPVHVTFTFQEDGDERTLMYFSVGLGRMRQRDLFLTCRSIYSNAASAFYSNNTFLIIENKDDEWGLPIDSVAESCIDFLEMLGSQAHWIRKLAVNVGCFDYDYAYMSTKCERQEFGFLLRFFWDHHLAVDVTCTNDRPIPVVGYNAPAVTRVMRSILEGQLMLKRPGSPGLCVSINYDGSGAVFILKSVAPPYDHHRRFEPDLDQRYSYVAEDEGRRLVLVRPIPILLSLPSHILHNIITKVVLDPGELLIDLDADTKLPLGIFQVKKGLYAEWRAYSLRNVPYTLLMSSRGKRSNFSNFDKLARLLRHQFNLAKSSEPKEMSILENSEELKIVLNFNLPEPTALEDLRISVLPLILETSLTKGDREVTIRSFAPGPDGQILVAEQAITFQKLRFNAVMAMMGDILESDDLYETLIWINGLGEVVDKSSERRVRPFAKHNMNTASTIEFHGSSWYSVVSLHEKDRRYRGENVPLKCVYGDCEQFFPFHHSASQILRYLM